MKTIKASVILFAYNQEKYVREAAESILAQKGAPLEVIFSDDCSSDRTYDILKEVVNAYKGIHRVRLNRNSTNLGLIQHVQFAAQMCSGDWIVMAAGDDVSSPERVETLMSAVVDNAEVAGIASAFHRINERGESLSRNNADNLRLMKMQDEPMPVLMAAARKGRGNFILAGAAAAWRKDLFIKFPPVPIGRQAIEDCVLRWRAKIMGKVMFIPADLVAYRTHSGALTNWGSQDPAEADDRMLRTMVQSRASWMQTVDDLEFALRQGFISKALFVSSLKEARKTIAFLDAFINWPTFSFMSRIMAMLAYPKSPLFRFGLRRLFQRKTARDYCNQKNEKG